MYKDEMFAVVTCVVILITLLFVGVIYAAINSPCNKQLYQCVNGELYTAQNNLMVGTNKKCFEKT